MNILDESFEYVNVRNIVIIDDHQRINYVFNKFKEIELVVVCIEKEEELGYCLNKITRPALKSIEF